MKVKILGSFATSKLAPLRLPWHCWTIVSHRGEELADPLLQLSSNFPNYFPSSQQFGVSKSLLLHMQPDLRQVASHTSKLMIFEGEGGPHGTWNIFVARVV